MVLLYVRYCKREITTVYSACDGFLRVNCPFMLNTRLLSGADATPIARTIGYIVVAVGFNPWIVALAIHRSQCCHETGRNVGMEALALRKGNV